jgi:hypothetical protein
MNNDQRWLHLAKLVPAIAAAVLALSACSSDLTEAGSRVRVIVAPDKLRPGMVETCQRVKDIVVNLHGGGDLSQDALNRSLNEAGEAGANAYSFTAETTDSWHGTTMYGVAWQCTRIIEMDRPLRPPQH